MTDTPIPKDEVLRGDYTHTMRDGTPATFPTGTKRAEMVDAISKYEGISPTDSAVAGFSRGTALGFGDEARAAIHAQFPEISKWMMAPPFDGKLTAGPVKNIITEGGPGMQGGETLYTPPAPQAPPPVSDAPTFDRRYDENLATARDEAKLHKTLNPYASLGGQIAGNVVTSAALPGNWLQPQAMIPWMLKSGFGNAMLGGVQGYGEGEGSLNPFSSTDRWGSAGTGAAIGAGAGALAPPAGALGKYIWKGVPTAMRGAADYLEAGAKRVPNVATSAAPVTQDIVQDSVRADMAHWLRTKSDSMVSEATLARMADDLASSRITPMVPPNPTPVGQLTQGERMAQAQADNSAFRLRPGERQAQTELDRLGEASTIANLSPNVARSARDSYILKGEGREVIEANLDAQRQRLGGDLREAAGVPGAPLADDARAAFKANQVAVGERVYGEALDRTPLNMTPELQAFDNNPAVRAARQAAIEDNAQHGVQLTEARLAHETKQYLNYIAEGKVTSGAPVSPRLAARTANDYEQALWNANPHIREADLRYAQSGGMERALDQGIDLSLGKGKEGFNAQSLARDEAQRTIGENTGLRWGTQNAIRAETESEPLTRALVQRLRVSDPQEGVRPRLAQIMPDRMDPLMREVNAQHIYGSTDRQIRGGAIDRAGDTITALENLGGGGGGVPTDPRAFLTRAGQWFLDKAANARNPTELMRNEYARIATTMDKQQQREALEIMADLLKKRREVPPPTQAGAAGGTGAVEPLVIDMTRRPNQ